jgi:LacI family transcriptional regulator
VASPEARARVLEAIDELDYHPHAFARGLRSQRTYTVGFIACDYSPLDVFVSPYSAGVLTGLAAELKDNGYYLLVHRNRQFAAQRSAGRCRRSPGGCDAGQ